MSDLEGGALAQALIEGRPRALRPAVFFDRDGVLNVDHGYVGTLARFEWVPNAGRAIKLANDAGYLVFVVTNQSGVARGLYPEGAVRLIHERMVHDLSATGARIDDIRYCPHHPEALLAGYRRACPCRKPEPGMIIDLMRAWNVDRARSFLVGDSESDIEAARRAGIAAVRMTPGDDPAALVESAIVPRRGRRV